VITDISEKRGAPEGRQLHGQFHGQFHGRRTAWQLPVPSLPLLVGVAVFARLLVERTALLHDPDTYLHIAAGQWMVAHHALPTHDPFSHSMPGVTWISSEWLAQLAMGFLYDQLGWRGVVLATAAAFALSIGLLTRFLLRRLDAFPSLIAVIATSALLEPHALARPHILALPLLVAWTGILLGARDDDRPPPYAALPLMVLWANLHASYLFGLALTGYLAVEAVWQAGADHRRREAMRWAGFVAAACLAALVNPHGIAGFVQPLRLMQMPALQRSFAEWLSPDFSKSPALEMWLLGLLLLGFTARLRLPATRLLLLLGLVHMTLQHARHGDLLAVVVPLAVAAPLGERLRPLLREQAADLTAWAARFTQPQRPISAVVAVLAAAIIALPTALTPIERVDDAVTPAAALAAAQRAGLSGPVFNSEAFGGYLIFRGIPTMIDGRAEMYGNDFLAEAYAAEQGDETAVARLLAAHPVTWAMLIPDTGAAGVLAHQPGWQRVYDDRYAIVYRRVAPPGG